MVYRWENLAFVKVDCTQFPWHATYYGSFGQAVWIQSATRYISLHKNYEYTDPLQSGSVCIRILDQIQVIMIFVRWDHLRQRSASHFVSEEQVFPSTLFFLGKVSCLVMSCFVINSNGMQLWESSREITWSSFRVKWGMPPLAWQHILSAETLRTSPKEGEERGTTSRIPLGCAFQLAYLFPPGAPIPKRNPVCEPAKQLQSGSMPGFYISSSAWNFLVV